MGEGERWLAMAWEQDEERHFRSAYADTPAAALRALAAELREAASRPDPLRGSLRG